MKIAAWYDQTQLVRASAGSVRDAILIGIGLAGLVLFLFLRNTRVIVIAMLVVPATLAITPANRYSRNFVRLTAKPAL